MYILTTTPSLAWHREQKLLRIIPFAVSRRKHTGHSYVVSILSSLFTVIVKSSSLSTMIIPHDRMMSSFSLIIFSSFNPSYSNDCKNNANVLMLWGKPRPTHPLPPRRVRSYILRATNLSPTFSTLFPNPLKLLHLRLERRHYKRLDFSITAW